ncbi:hypothetical protein SAMN06264364_102169 [Quadrisphaera granulorum]|uniref:Uncharacterized protein n=1 Tax=Quadrisphaera granulorum TaxID=317664 RepID=A0A316ADI7_9ACTN|nr:hypothetical protein BXY45_102169 [Quadrisphaera granulorum]SZE95300.1 hypothetical protein SAMN06264364_102169 [Quadrisphaera granulorum]
MDEPVEGIDDDDAQRAPMLLAQQVQRQVVQHRDARAAAAEQHDVGVADASVGTSFGTGHPSIVTHRVAIFLG